MNNILKKINKDKDQKLEKQYSQLFIFGDIFEKLYINLLLIYKFFFFSSINSNYKCLDLKLFFCKLGSRLKFIDKTSSNTLDMIIIITSHRIIFWYHVIISKKRFFQMISSSINHMYNTPNQSHNNIS